MCGNSGDNGGVPILNMSSSSKYSHCENGGEEEDEEAERTDYEVTQNNNSSYATGCFPKPAAVSSQQILILSNMATPSKITLCGMNRWTKEEVRTFLVCVSWWFFEIKMLSQIIDDCG
jgi:hypothetical protein